MKLLKLLVLSALLAFTANSAKAGVPDGIWTIPEPQGLEFTTFTVDVNNPSGHHYYLYNPATKMFFSSGNGWYTQASLRTFGMEIWLESATEYDAPEGSYELWDNNCNNPARYTGEGNMFTDGTDGTWVDHASQDYYSWSYEIVDDCVRFQNVALIADRPEYTGKYLGFDGTFVTVSNTESDVRHLDAWTAILRHVDPSAPGVSVDWKAVTPESYQAFVGSAGYQAYVDGVEAYIAAMDLKVTIEEAEALYIDVTAALAVYTNTESMPDQLKEAASDLQLLIDAKKKLKESIEYYESNGFTDTAAAKAVLTNPQATVEEIEQAKADLDAAFVAWGTTNASVETPADMTGKIINPNFDGASSLGWLGTVPNMTGSGTHGPANVAEHWNKTFDTYQDIEGLPAGVYQLTAETSWRGTWEDLQNGVTGSKVYVKEGDTEYSVPFNNIFKPRNTEPLAGPTSFGTWANELTEYQDGITYYYPDDPSCFRVYADKGWYDTKMTFAKLEEGSLRLGVALPQGVSSDNWSCFDTFTLKYFGNDVDAVKLFASEAWPFQPIQLDKNEVLFTEQYLAAYNDSVDAYNPDEVTSIAYFLEKKAAVQAVYDALQANIDLWQQWNQAVDDANYRATDLGWTEPWNMEGGMSDYLSGVENIMMACELTNEQLEEDIAKIQAMIAECEDYVTNHLSIEIPTDGLVAYYPFNGNANDVSGHGNNGTPMDNVTLTMGVHGDANGAYQFGGTDNPGHIHIPNSESLVINDGWSFATYIKPTSYNGMNGWGEPAQYGGHAIMGKSHDQHGFSIYYDITEETLRTKIGHWGDEWEADATVSGKFLNHWTHIAYTYSSNSGFCVYINGEMVCRSDKTPDFSVANTQDYYLGKYNDFWYPMNGIMDEVAIYNRALTADEVRQMAQYAEDSTNETIPTEAIDLGLPSGTKWAPWNVGASKPEDYGGYYAWGETEERSVYSYESYMYYDASSDTYIDIGSEISGTQYDVAHVKWGGEWQMPTKDQIQELLDNCSSEWTTMNGVNGRKFTGSNGNSIFLPATGSCWTDGVDNAGICSWYWSGTLTPWGGYDWLAYDLSFDNDHPRLAYDGIRASGCPVRPVFASSGNTDVEPYAVLSDDGKTVTFYYDNQKASRGGIDINNSYTDSSPYGTATTAVFDASFADYRPVNTKFWFVNCSSLTTITGIKNLNTSNVTDMYYMFYGCSGLTSLDVSGFDTSNVTNMSFMFCWCSNLTSLDVNGINTSKVTDMDAMFYDCHSLTNLDLGGFDTSNVTNMRNMFVGCSGLTNLDLSGFNTSNVTDMGYMFHGCSGLTSLDVSGFDTSNVTYMWNMFAYCSGLTSLDVSGFNTSNVTNMSYMFGWCSNLTTIYADETKWGTANVTDSGSMFYNCTSLVGGNGTEFDTNHTDAEYARIDKPGQPGYLTQKGGGEPEPYAVLSDNNTVITFYYDGNKESRNGMSVGPFEKSSSCSWYNQSSTITTAVFDGSFSSCTSLTSTAYWFNRCENLTTIKGIENLKTDNVIDMSSMFSLCSSLTNLDVSGFMTDNVTDMSAMFQGCSGIASIDVSGFKTDNVTDMGYLFWGCSSLTSLDLSGFKTDNVTNMSSMFYNCSSLTSLDVSGFKTDNVTKMSCMFMSSGRLTSLDLSGFKTDNVTDMSYMFCQCYYLTSLDLSGFKTDNVTDMNYMFYNCSGLTSLDLSGFKTDNVTSMGNMFDNCFRLTTIYAGNNWSTDAVVWGTDMFTNCTSLVGGNGTVFDANHTDSEYARIDKPGQPGYFTEKNAEQMDIEPIDQGETVDFSEEIDDNTDLDGNVVGDIYYNISAGDGSYNAAEGCIVVTTPTDDSVIDGQDIFGEDFQDGFTGIVFKVPAGKGTVKVEAQTFGAMVLKVKIGDNDPIEMELEGRLKVSFPYNVTEPTYVYIYGGTTSQSGVRRAANEPSSLKIYGIECTTTSVNGDADGDGTIDVNDITCVAAHILGRNPANFNAAAADADGDGTIDVNDITVIAGMILNSGK